MNLSEPGAFFDMPNAECMRQEKNPEGSSTCRGSAPGYPQDCVTGKCDQRRRPVKTGEGACPGCRGPGNIPENGRYLNSASRCDIDGLCDRFEIIFLEPECMYPAGISSSVTGASPA